MGVDFTFYKNRKIQVDGSEYLVLGGIEFYNSHDGSRWNEYRLTETRSGQERWLSIDNLYEEYAIYTQQAYSDEFTPDQISRSGYRSSDSGRATVASCFGAVDADQGEWVTYEEYEDGTEEYLMSIEQWEDGKEYSKGYYLDANEITAIDSDFTEAGQEGFYRGGSTNTAGKRKKYAKIAIGVAVVMAIIVMSIVYGVSNSKSIRKIISKNSAFTYTTSITSDLNSKKKADVYETYLSVEEAVKLIIREVDGKTEEVQADEDGESVAILTKKEYCLVYQSEDGETLVQISSRSYAYQSTNRPYRSTDRIHRHYRSFYYTWGLPKDRTSYDNTRSGYDSYDDTTLARDNSDPYRSYSNSIRQSSINTRKSSGGGISSGK